MRPRPACTSLHREVRSAEHALFSATSKRTSLAASSMMCFTRCWQAGLISSSLSQALLQRSAVKAMEAHVSNNLQALLTLLCSALLRVCHYSRGQRRVRVSLHNIGSTAGLDGPHVSKASSRLGWMQVRRHAAPVVQEAAIL